MEPEKLPSAFDIPAFRLEFKWLNLLLAFCSGLAGIFGIFVTLPERFEAYPRLRIGVVVLLLLAAVVSLLYPWLREIGSSVYGRLCEYPRVHQRAGLETTALSTLRQHTIGLMQHAASCAVGEEHQLVRDELASLIQRVFAVGLEALAPFTFQIEQAAPEKGGLIIAVKDAERSLRLGDKLMVIDVEDFYHMGTFTVNQERSEKCIAVGGGDVDKLWVSAVKELGEGSLVSRRIAVLVERSA